MKAKLTFLWGLLSLCPVSMAAQAEVMADTCCFKVNVTQMMPVSYPSRVLSYGYSLELRDDTARVCLPYMGRVYQPVLNDDGFRFELPVEHFRTRTLREGVERVEFVVRKVPVTYKFTVTLYGNDRADIMLIPSNAQSISYFGDLEVEDEAGTGKLPE